jgi:hypothetical protein
VQVVEHVVHDHASSLVERSAELGEERVGSDARGQHHRLGLEPAMASFFESLGSTASLRPTSRGRIGEIAGSPSFRRRMGKFG